MESVAYILVLALGIAVLFFAIAFREPPRITKD
jgi:photosystem II PsbT protein